jgi:hypothetical protein
MGGVKGCQSLGNVRTGSVSEKRSAGDFEIQGRSMTGAGNSLREFPDIGCVFFLTRQIKESWHGRGIAKARCSLRNKLGLRIYPALFVIRTLTANRKLNEWGARSCGCSRHAFSGSRKHPSGSTCCNQVRKSSHTRQWRGFLSSRRKGFRSTPRRLRGAIVLHYPWPGRLSELAAENSLKPSRKS